MASKDRQGFRLFHPSYKDRDGAKREAAKWYVEFVHADRPRRCPAFTSERESRKLGELLVKMSADVSIHGRLVDADLTKSAAGLPDRIRRLLAKWNILEPQQANVGADLGKLLERWRQGILNRSLSGQYADQDSSRATALIRACRFRRLSDFNRTAVEAALAKWRTDGRPEEKKGGRVVVRKVGQTTSNAYLAALGAFVHWCIDEQIIRDDPLSGAGRVEVTDATERAILEPGEQALFVAAAESSGAEWWSVDGRMRGMIYRLALATGLRSNEIRVLHVGDFKLNGKQPTITLHAGGVKNKQGGEQPLPPAIVPMLKAHLANKLPTAPAFKLPSASLVVKMFRRDLAAARTAWIGKAGNTEERQTREASDFLCDRRHNGEVLVFHSLRHSFIANLKRAGVPLTTAMQLARHHDPKLTAKRYGTLGLHDLAGAVAALPTVARPTDQAGVRTGTDNLLAESGENCLAPCLAQPGTLGRTPLDATGRRDAAATSQQEPVNTGKTVFFGSRPELSATPQTSAIPHHQENPHRFHETGFASYE